MRFRGKSIRRKIVALLLVPLVSLTAIWGFATVLTGREAADLFNVSSVVEKVSYPTEDAVRVLQQERRQTLVYLADPRASDALAALRRSRTATDDVIAKIRDNADKAGVRNSISDSDSERLTAVLEAFDGIGALRRGIEEGTVTRTQALRLYSNLVDPCYALLANLHIIDNLEMDKQARALVNIARARELLSREDALLGSALVAGKVTRDESRAVSDLVAQRTVMYDVSLPLLPQADRGRYERFWKSASTAPLRAAEQAVIGTESGRPRGVTAKSWDTTAGDVLDGLSTLNDESADRYQDRIQPVVTDVIVQAVVAGVLGLVALLVSVFLSVRIGRTLIRDLRQLRLEAHEASGVRLPSVMRRLSAGEQVDVETEVPRLEYDRNEIGEVGQALNTLQRAAVEAAVKQAELRSGVSEVFVNLARRSQVLLHKQLTLLDTMERRTEDTDELADLFRLDHLTTRMRRHAEGLVILSGAAPSRQWRKPVQLMDVVRAAVAEVEDYERIEVRRLPRMAVTGPAVADLTHLVAELLENATVFSPPHTAIQVLGERVANGFTLEIHDRGLGMAAEALLDANLRLAETPEFELSDTDRLGLFVVSRLAQRQNVRVSLQPSPYGGTTAVVFVPDALLTDDIPDTNGIGFRLDRAQPSKEAEFEEGRRAALSAAPVRLPGLPASLIDGPVELGAPVDLDALSDFSGPFGDADGDHVVPSRPHRPTPATTGETTGLPGDRHQQPSVGWGAPGGAAGRPGDPATLPRRRTPKLVSSHGRPVTEQPSRRGQQALDEQPADGAVPAGQDTLAPLPARRRGETAIRREADRGDRGEGFGDRTESSVRRWEGRGETTGRGLDDRTEPTGSRGFPDRTDMPAPLFGDRSAGGRTDAPARGVGGWADTGRNGLGGGLPPEAPALPQRGRRGGSAGTPARPGAAADPAESGTAGLPRRVRQANLAPQLRDGPERRAERTKPRPQDGADPFDRDADEVRSRMASLQRGWQRGRDENAGGDNAQGGTAQGTSKGDGR
ncbi:nitrate- and nitrite sensing domain-containing protein [Streptomyces graminilatus]|uniref:sensor histidine kinase n=1 Tax=Streptomyces graminilatus TaxID=1464070 RepID=UPI0006E3AC3C|nr:nitrate- and nitrite sensing domain-containing protein [Streptomyces graminilatus]